LLPQACHSWKNEPDQTGWTDSTLAFCSFLEHQCRRFNWIENSQNSQAFPEYLCTIMTMGRLTYLKCFRPGSREVQNTCCVFIIFRKSCHMWDSVEKCSTSWQATHDDIIWGVGFVCWINKARIQTQRRFSYIYIY
jgi:hypothetical protein